MSAAGTRASARNTPSADQVTTGPSPGRARPTRSARCAVRNESRAPARLSTTSPTATIAGAPRCRAARWAKCSASSATNGRDEAAIAHRDDEDRLVGPEEVERGRPRQGVHDLDQGLAECVRWTSRPRPRRPPSTAWRRGRRPVRGAPMLRPRGARARSPPRPALLPTTAAGAAVGWRPGARTARRRAASPRSTAARSTITAASLSGSSSPTSTHR